MARITKFIDDKLVERCRKELARQGIKGESGRRLQAIISAKKHGIKKVAEVYNISRETLMRWIRKFKEGGTDAFSVAPGRGPKRKLTEEQKDEIKAYVEKDGANMTAKTLQLHIQNKYGIELSNTTAFRLLKKLGFSHISPRPIHHKQDPKAQQRFKKKS